MKQLIYVGSPGQSREFIKVIFLYHIFNHKGKLLYDLWSKKVRETHRGSPEVIRETMHYRWRTLTLWQYGSHRQNRPHCRYASLSLDKFQIPGYWRSNRKRNFYFSFTLHYHHYMCLILKFLEFLLVKAPPQQESAP